LARRTFGDDEREAANMNYSASPTLNKRPKNTHIFERDEHDFYVEPAWCSERLFGVEEFVGPIHDPGCGIGRIILSAVRAGHLASGSDIVERGMTRDFAFDYLADTTPLSYPNIVCNPPYHKAKEFIARAVREARKSAFLVPYGFLFSGKRAAWFKALPLKRIWALVPRPSMPPGELILAGMQPGGGRVDYCWCTFERGHSGPPVFGWLER
jgi:hypothetical protein